MKLRSFLRLLSIAPFLGMLGGVGLVNRVTPFVFGLPLVLAWIVAWVVLSVAIMAVIYVIDPANRAPDDEPP